MTPHLWPTAAFAAGLAAFCALHTIAQTQSPQLPASESLRFEVASLKPSPTDAQGGGIIRPTPGNQGYLATNMPLRAYLMIAYVVRNTQITGAPSWFDNDRYDMSAKAEKPSTIEELHIMLQNLLADRCGIKIHKERKETSGYALVIEKVSPKHTEHDHADKNYPSITPVGSGKVQCINATLNLFALFISRGLDLPVVDKTGLTAHYDFTFEIVPDRVAGPDGQERVAPPDGAMVSEALKAQLGLRLDRTKATNERIVIDHVEKPSAN
jgi:uncharacterized protein (TIGR03435 family)